MQMQSAQAALRARKFYFQYTTPTVTTLAAAGTATNVINFDNDAAFLWLKTVFFCDLAGAAITSSARIIPLCTVQLTDTGSGQAFFNAPIPIPSMAGESASLPFILPAPQMVQPNTSYQFSFANYSAATTYANLRIQLIGFKLYDA